MNRRKIKLVKRTEDESVTRFGWFISIVPVGDNMFVVWENEDREIVHHDLRYWSVFFIEGVL
jgi:hypothetical protein